MLAFDIQKLAERMKLVRNRTHNMPEDMQKAEISEEIEKSWNEVMGKPEQYVQGEHIVEKGGYFSALSMGNWHILCDAAGVELIPSRVVAVVNPIHAFSLLANGMNDENVVMLADIMAGIQDIKDDEILRFDVCAPTQIKTELTLGRDHSGIVKNKGWSRNAEGYAVPDLPDERVLDMLMNNPEDHSPVWIRKWIDPVMMEGDARRGYQSAVSKEDRLADDQEMPQGIGNKFPCEWRVFVKNGKVEAIGNYYPQISRATTLEDETIAIEMVRDAKAAAERLIAKMAELKAIPHNPHYEQRADLDPDAIHFSLDFIETEDDQAPHGRRLVMIEGGTAHLRAPHFGAHPVSFGMETEPKGVAFSLTDIRPLDIL